jgi:hypothetical protein
MTRHCLYIAVLACLAAVIVAALPAAAQAGLTVRHGKLYRDGRVYRGIGVNQCDLFQELIANGKDTRALDALRFLGRKGIPFVRFWACGFWPSDWDLYFSDKAEWFRRLDLVVRCAEQANVGLIPDLFWNTHTIPQLVGEYNDQWAEPDSKTQEFMRTYVREVVTRYRNSPAIWGWEFTNEFNLNNDLPNGMEFLGQSIPSLKWNLEKTERNLLTHQATRIAMRAFAREVRKYDPYRFVTTGNSCPRGCAYHIGEKLESIWGDDDADQAFRAFRWQAPWPNDVISVHWYGDAPEKLKYAGEQGTPAAITNFKRFASRMGQPLFVGEFSGLGPEDLKPRFAEYQKECLDSVLANKVDLAAYWVFEYTSDRTGMGLVRASNEWSWILDQIVDYNVKIAAQLEAEG